MAHAKPWKSLNIWKAPIPAGKASKHFLTSYEIHVRELEGWAVELEVHGLLSLVDHIEERLEHVVEAQGPKVGERQEAAD